jgi:hypothetical protein
LLKEHFVDTLPPHDNPLSSDCVPSLARSDCEVFITNEHQKQYLNQRLAYGRLLKKECFLVDSMDPRTKQQVQAERTRISGKSFPLDCLPTADMANLIFSRRWA